MAKVLFFRNMTLLKFLFYLYVLPLFSLSPQGSYRFFRYGMTHLDEHSLCLHEENEEEVEGGGPIREGSRPLEGQKRFLEK